MPVLTEVLELAAAGDDAVDAAAALALAEAALARAEARLQALPPAERTAAQRRRRQVACMQTSAEPGRVGRRWRLRHPDR
jgi:Tfp pilus assembly protein PilX